RFHRAIRKAGAAAAALAAFVVVAGLVTRSASQTQLREWTDNQASPTVTLVSPNADGEPATLSLPGRLEAYFQAPLSARTSGYLKDWKVDIGARVKAGQLIAEIDAPDLDQQLLQAEADLASAQANVKLSDATLRRGQVLIGKNDIAQQDLDQRTADL